MKYNVETTKSIVELYQGGTSPEDIAESVGTNKRSVVAKLSQLGVYQSKRYLNKRGEVPIKKEQLLDQIAAKLGVDVEVVESLEKCNKNVLILILSHLKGDN